MAYPFPERPITQEVLDREIEAGGWTANTCPLCDRAAASWSIEKKDASRFICPTCQRFTISGPQRVALQVDSDVVRQRKKALSEAAATSQDVLHVG
jgi:hypothetical protein